MTPTVGVVGLGAMGGPIAGHLVAAGFEVLTHDRSGARVEGARAVASATELASTQVVVVIVPTDDDTDDVCRELFAACAAGTVVVLSSSLRPATCRDLRRRGAEHGIDVLDAALTGGVRGAVDGRLNLLVGGDEAVVARVAEVFRAYAAGWHVLGPVGAGQVGKSAGNLIHWAQVVAIVESLRLAERHGVSPARLRAALQDGPTDSRALREIQLMRFTWYAKDIEIAQELAAAVDLPVPQASLSRKLMDSIDVDAVRTLLEAPPH